MQRKKKGKEIDYGYNLITNAPENNHIHHYLLVSQCEGERNEAMWKFIIRAGLCAAHISALSGKHRQIWHIYQATDK